MCPWVRLDDHLDDDSRIATVGPAGAGLLVLLLVYSNKTLADGFVSEAIVQQKALGLPNAADVIASLVNVRLLARSERDGIDGYEIAEDLVKHQPTRESVLAAREVTRQRKERWRAEQAARLHTAQPKRRRRALRAV